MKNDLVIDTMQCEHCNRKFVRETSFFKHVCEQKKRWLDKDKPGNRIAFNSWKNFYQKYHPNKKSLEYKDFLTSTYYNSFLKFGNYCVEADVLNPSAYFIYLSSNRVPIDSWASDNTYTKYLTEYLLLEDGLEAVERSLEFLLDISVDENIKISDVFNFVNPNKLCYSIIKGKVSPWVLYQSDTGKVFLANLNKDQTGLIFDYIDPKKWSVKFHRDSDVTNTVKRILKLTPL